MQEGLDATKGYSTRTQNPRAALEGNPPPSKAAAAGFAFASGIAHQRDPVAPQEGDHVIVSDNVYGGSTFRLFDKVLTRYQLSFTYVDTGNLDAVRARLHGVHTRLVFVETPSNPGDAHPDLAAAAASRTRRETESGRQHLREPGAATAPPSAPVSSAGTTKALERTQ